MTTVTKLVVLGQAASLRLERARAVLVDMRRETAADAEDRAEALDFVIGMVNVLAGPVSSLCIVDEALEGDSTRGPEWIKYSIALDTLTCHRCGGQLAHVAACMLGDGVAAFTERHARCAALTPPERA